MKRILTSIKAHAGVSAITAGREYRNEAPDTATVPYLVVSMAATSPGADLSGGTGIDRHRIQVDAWAKTHADKDNLVTAIKAWVKSVNANTASHIERETYDPSIHFQLVPKDEQTDFNNLRGASRGLLEYDIWLTH